MSQVHQAKQNKKKTDLLLILLFISGIKQITFVSFKLKKKKIKEKRRCVHLGIYWKFKIKLTRKKKL